MTWILALLERWEGRWLRQAVGELTLRNGWPDCQLESTADLREWERGRTREGGPPAVVICDLSIPGAIEALKRVRGDCPRALVLPLVTPEIHPSRYVHPDILPFALLWKPLGQKENGEALYRTLAQVYAAGQEPGEGFFTVRTRTETWRLPYREICCFEAREKKIYLRTGEQEIGFYGTMAQLERELPEDFVRCHKGYLVNRRHINRIDWTRRVIEMRERIRIPISKTYRAGIGEKISGAF